MSLTVMRQRTVKYLTDLGKYGRSEYTLDKAFNEIYLPDLKHRKVKTIPEIVRNYNVDLKDRFGSYKLEEIKSVDLLKWFNETSTRSKGAANNCSTLLKALFKLCIKADIGLSVDPTSVLTKNPDIKRVRTLNKLEVIRLKEALNEAKNKSLYAWSFIMVLYLTGARKGELAKATWEDYINNLPKDNKTIFKIKDPKKVWDFIRHKADIPDFRMHDFRHNFASLGINNGIEMIRVAKLTGHKSIISMQRYQHVNEATALEDNKLLGNILTD
jgi:integrase